MINRVLASGFLFGDGASAYTPEGVERMVFEAAIGQSDGERGVADFSNGRAPDGRPSLVSWHCEISNPELIERVRGRLVRGRVVFIEGELAARKFEKHGVQVGWTRFLRVTKCELPEGRSKVADDSKAGGVR